MAVDSADPESAAPARVTPRVLVFFDYACQFCYLDWPRFKRLRRQHGAELFLVPFELRPELPTAGALIADLGVGHSERVREHMLRMAREGGLELAFPVFLPNTHLALTLGEYARDLGPETHEAVHHAVLAAYSGVARDIGRRDVLLDVAEECGLDTADVACAFDDGRYDERLGRFRDLALSLGIAATPAALICNELLIGSRPYQVLAHALEHCVMDERTILKQGATSAHGSDEHVDTAEEGAAPSITR